MALLAPAMGSVSIDGVTPEVIVSRLPGLISYIPQEVVVGNASIR